MPRSLTPARTEAASEHSVPVTLVRHLVDLVQRWHIPPSELLIGSGLVGIPADPCERLPLETMIGLLERARLLTGEPGLGYYLALQQRASTYGYIGLAASSASTVRGAIELAIKYAPLFSTALSISLRVELGYAFLRLDEKADLGSARDIVLIHMMLGLETLANVLTGRQEHAAAELAIPEPPYNARFAHLVPRWKFGQPAHCVILDARALDWPILAADPLSLDLMRALCERALADLGFDDGLVEQVERLVARDSGRLGSMNEVARHLSLSPRTFSRRLAAQGASFSSLVERARQEQAQILLRTSQLSIETISRRLGYAGASTFVRAFRSWTGRTPAVYRRESKPHVKRRSRP